MANNFHTRMMDAIVLSPEFYLIDTETTELDDPNICQIAVVSNTGETMLNTYVKPVKAITKGARAVHGITDALIENAPTWVDVRELILDIVQGCPLLIYNSDFDVRVMKNSSKHHGLTPIKWRKECDVHCVMKAYSAFGKHWNKQKRRYNYKKLTYAVQECGLLEQTAHDALADTMMTLSLVHHMLNKWEA